MPERWPQVEARYAVGIDLGTSHTVLAYSEIDAADAEIRLFGIDQLVGPGQVAALPLLPSVRYQAAAGELAEADLGLPWQPEEAPLPLVGRWARELGAQSPGRLVASAKSWLSHAGVDRTAPILPWGAPDEVDKVSPLQASASYLAHLRSAWNARFPGDPLERQQIVLTVPASFDEGARALTLEAARSAGLPALKLLEEPQAALQDWLWRHRQTLDHELADARLVLVVDVGGGTTDLTLVQIEREPDGRPKLTRIGVGDHLMLGGDNMDLALAHRVERELGGRLSAARLSQLVQRCRVAKEQLLAQDAPERVGVTLLGAGSRLVGGARSVELEREQVERLVVDGFLPLDDITVLPRRRGAGIVEFGLPYPADPAITHHIAAFLARHAQAAREAVGDENLPALPDTLLLNGGVFRSHAISDRIARLLAGWRGAGLKWLHNDSPDVAVARGAVAHQLLKRDSDPAAIGGGSARSYFLLVAQDGDERAVCVLPRATPEGQEVALADRSFMLTLGRAVRFHLASSVDDRRWRPGEIADADAEAGFVRLPPLAALLPAPPGRRSAEVEVSLAATMTEVGTLEMHCVAANDPKQRWKLAFELRGAADDQVESAPVHPKQEQAIALIDRVFGEASQRVDAREVRQLRGSLERLLGPREGWDLALLRALFDALLERAKRRRRSAEHERAWLNLAGYSLRPGCGAPLDDWRVEQLWRLYPQGLQYPGESNNWSEWWTLWRRAAGGLDDSQQLELLQTAGEYLEQIVTSRQAGNALRGSQDDMLRLVAALERVPPAYRTEIGDWLVDRLDRGADKPGHWWVVGRLGARVSLYGSAQNVVPGEVAERWLQAILALDWRAVEPAAFAAAQIARVSGDRARDLAPGLRERVIERLEAVKASAWAAMVRERVELDEADSRRSYGEALPPGLRLV